MDPVCLLIILGLAGIALTYCYLTSTFDYWTKQNVPSLPNPLPGLGHMLPLLSLRESLAGFGLRLYHSPPESASMVGFYFLRRPAVLVREPELVRRILHADFPSFNANVVRLSKSKDPVLSKHPAFVEEPQAWKTLRARIVSHLTGKKLRSLFRIVDEVGKKLNAYTSRKIDSSSSGQFECDLKEFSMRFTGEVVANTAFAIEGQSFDDNPDEMAFANVAATVFASSVLNSAKQTLVLYASDLANLLGLRMLQKSTDEYFRRTIRTILQRRRQSGEKPDDFLQFCVDACGEDDMDGIIADVITYYVDVYETTSLTLADTLYYISENQEVQDRLREHINAQTSNGVTFESLQNMNYLDQVIQETMRLLVPVGVLMRRCTAPITLEGSDGLRCRLRVNDYACISATGLHLDEKIWPDPQRFDPDRFSPENQAARHKYVYLPFGEGPRMCVGSRLGLSLVKHAVATLIKNYKVVHSPRTRTPLELESFSGDMLSRVKGSLWGRFEKLEV